MPDTNVVILTGRVVSTAERVVGQRGQTLTELRLAVTRPGRKGEAESEMTVPVTVWASAVGTAVRALPVGTPLTVLGRLQAREWQDRIFLDLVAESVSVNVEAVPTGDQRALNLEAPARTRPPDPRTADDSDPIPY
jgi:single-stranded DNA-binding protein